MKHLGRLLIVLFVVVTFATSVQSNTISADEPTKVLALWNRITEFYRDLTQVGLATAQSLAKEPSRAVRETVWCIMRIEAQTQLIESDVYGVLIATQMSSSLNDPADEKLTLQVVKIALSRAATGLADGKSEINNIFGTCARQDQLTYDRAKALLNLVDETNKIIAPMLRRVAAAT
jgi:hypothetical protein